MTTTHPRRRPVRPGDRPGRLTATTTRPTLKMSDQERLLFEHLLHRLHR